MQSELQGERKLQKVNRLYSDRLQGGALKSARTVQAFQDNARRFSQAVDGAPVPIMVHAEDGEVIQVSRVLEEKTGYDLAAIPNLKGWNEKVFVDFKEVLQQGADPLFSMEQPGHQGETRVRTAMGGEMVWDITSAPIGCLPDGRRMVISTAVDLTERKRAEEELRKRERDFRRLIESSVDAVVVVDTDGAVLFVNPAAEKLFGRSAEDFLGKGFGFPLVGGEFVEIEVPHRGGPPAVAEMRVVETEWEERPALLATLRDVTERKILALERKRTEAQLRQAQKMEAIGTLAGGIAHDFNNILTILLGYTELALYAPDDPEGLKGYLQEALTAGNRAKDLVQQILAFSRESEQESRPIRVLTLVNETLKLLRASLPSSIDIRQRLLSDDLILGDPTQVHQILMNLCTNAAHAMREEGGTLTVSLETAACRPVDFECESEEAMFCSPVDPKAPEDGGYLRLEVSDTGHGIPEAIRDRIFDPYFSTKEKEEGTGLGLALVMRLVKALGGTVTVESTVGRGTTFAVYLPVFQQPCQAEKAPVEAVEGGTEHILVVDDEEAIVEMARETLESMGYTVESCTGSPEALARFKADPNAFDLVITDMTMPKMTGDRLAREMMSIRSDIPIILCTGYSELMNEKAALKAGIRAFVMKPLVRSKLAAVIRRAFDPMPSKQ